ncbi:probable cytochrome P450 6d5 [Sitodiplosis mosellana]|uniref:probable cytochrome P450 6d5 n=1 Tax=Sitodiplosis mosellana TaxID=263140 RepID=UPI002444F29A|nr:probable cytochrome P450 6d5 [Sitodiplosis mosellana]
MTLLLILISVLTTLIVTAFIYIKYKFSYWRRKGVAYVGPSIPFGNFGAVIILKKSFDQVLNELYNSSNEPIVGIYTGLRPSLLIRDQSIARDILIKDFQSFWHRGYHYDEKLNPLAGNLFANSGEKWKMMRSKLSPAFSSSKIKAMFDTIVDCGQSLENHIAKYDGKEIEVREIFARFTTNVIASVAFGINIDCIENPNDEFREYSRRFFETNATCVFRFLISFVSPFLTKLLRIRYTDTDVEHFMRETIRQNLDYREQNDVIRKDFFQILIQLRNAGTVQGDSDWSTKTTAEKSLSLDDMTAQAFIFIVAGYESSSTTMSYCLYELAKNPELQQQIYEEILSVLRNHNNRITYDSLSEMKCLDNCIDETLRLYPPFDALTRECTKDYTISNSNVVIEKGTPIYFSITGPQYDPQFYDQPNKFIPDRFKDHQKSVDAPFWVFGDGPRNCIGMRLGKVLSKLGVCLLLHKFEFELGTQHMNAELEFEAKSIVKAPISGIHLKCKKKPYNSLYKKSGK